jgi:hypothetical protein
MEIKNVHDPNLASFAPSLRAKQDPECAKRRAEQRTERTSPDSYRERRNGGEIELKQLETKCRLLSRDYFVSRNDEKTTINFQYARKL